MWNQGTRRAPFQLEPSMTYIYIYNTLSRALEGLSHQEKHNVCDDVDSAKDQHEYFHVSGAHFQGPLLNDTLALPCNKFGCRVLVISW